MKKNFLRWFGGVLAALALGVHAEPVTPELAMDAANAWVRKNAAFGAAGEATRALAVSNAAQTAVLWYQVSMSNGGMLVVAPDTDVEPVVAALEKDPGDLPAAHPLRALLTADIQRRLAFLGLDAASVPSAARTRVVAAPTSARSGRSDVAEAWAEEQNAKWTKLIEEGDSGMRRAAAVRPGVADVPVQIGIVDGFESGGRFTHWNQSTDPKDGQKCYNYHTPSNVPCGCVATACAAVMQCFAVTGPEKPMENDCSYNNGLKEKYAMLGGVYDWDVLPITYGGTNETTATTIGTTALSDVQRELLGRVAYDAGVGVGMAWGDEASSAFMDVIANMFKTAYGFKDARFVDSPSPEQYAKLIYHQCAAGAPVLMSIGSESSGHAVVAVGYGRDADNVARTRVFLGWGGAGDAWYALPDVTTQSVLGGDVEDFTVLDGVVTMLGYDSDEVIPVVGQVVGAATESEFEISVDGAWGTNGLTRTIVSTNGYFATRVSPLVDPKTLTCRGNVATFEVGADAATSADADELDAALPDFINFALMNASVAYSMESALARALAEGKAVLRVSGTVGETNTESLVQYIYDLDRANVNDFTNRFVYYFASADAAAGDGNPSYGIFLPQEATVEDNWVAANGRLAYGFASASTTNIYNQVGDLVSTAEVVRVFTAWRTTNIYEGTTNTYETVDGTNTVAIETSVQKSLQTVLTNGWDAYLRQTSGISLTVTAVPEEAGKVDPAYGSYANVYTNGEVVTATCPAVVTNAAKTVVMSCTGWTLTNETTGVCETGVVGTNTYLEVSNTFSVASNDVFTLTWQFKTNFVYVSVSCTDDGAYGTVSPGSGWYEYGKPVIITAVPNANGHFTSFGAPRLPADAVKADCAIAWTVRDSVELTANFRRGSDTTVYANTNTLTVVAYAAETGDDGNIDYTELSLSPAYWIAGAKGMEEPQMVSAGVPIDVPATKLLVVPAETTFAEDGTGVVWRLVRVGVTNELENLDPKNLVDETENAVLAIDVSTNKVACFIWERETSSSGGGDTPDDPDAGEPEVPVGENGGSPLTIIANGDGTLTVQADIVNAKPGWWYAIVSADDLAGSWARVPAAKLTVANDSVKATEKTVSLQITFASEAAARFYKVKVTQDELPN